MSGCGGGNKIRTFEEFVTVHGILLTASGIPQSLYRLLFEKLSNESFDGGEFFQIEPVEEVEGRQRRLVFTSDFMQKESNVFLVDHAWTFRISDAYKQLQEIPGLAERMASLMCVDIDLDAKAEDACDMSGDVCPSAVNAAEIVKREFCKVKEGGADAVRWLELDELDVDDTLLVSLDLPSKFPVSEATILKLSRKSNLAFYIDKLIDMDLGVKLFRHFRYWGQTQKRTKMLYVYRAC